jgi:hypothetical protein
VVFSLRFNELNLSFSFSNHLVTKHNKSIV